MGHRSWTSVSEETCKTSIAAWEWLQNGFRPDLLDAPFGLVKLELALFSRLLLPYTLIRENNRAAARGEVLVCLGHASWAGLVWPTRQLSPVGEAMGTFKVQVENYYKQTFLFFTINFRL